ncbi:MAG: beta-eliminating lyase-related protein, partial [Chloroflexota bacterium]
EEFIYKAHRARKMLGGGMRQAGILAAAGIISLKDMSRRLDDDHKNAKRLAHGLADIPHIKIDPEKCYTNMVFFGLEDSAPLSEPEITAKLKSEHNVLMGGTYGNGFRAVTHYWIDEEKVNIALDGMRSILN